MIFSCRSEEPFDKAQDKLRDEESVTTKPSVLQYFSGLRFFTPIGRSE